MKKRYKREANGCGSVIPLSGNRRKKYAFRITVGFTEEGKQLYKYLGYYETKQEANDAKAMYSLIQKKKNLDQVRRLNTDLFDSINEQMKNELTFLEIFKLVREEEKGKLSEHRIQVLDSTVKHFEKIHNKKISDVTLQDMQSCINVMKDKGLRKGSVSNAKIVCTKIFKYAVIHQYIGRNDDYSKYIDIYTNSDRKTIHEAIPRDILKEMLVSDDRFDKIAIVYCLTGCRPNEFYKLDPNNIHLEEGYIITGSKTEAGRNRVVPIHPLIKDMFMEVLGYIDQYASDIVMNKQFNKYNKRGLLQYNCRVTFATLCRESGVTVFADKKVMGHKFNDITEDVYTHESIEYLIKEIEKINL